MSQPGCLEGNEESLGVLTARLRPAGKDGDVGEVGDPVRQRDSTIALKGERLKPEYGGSFRSNEFDKLQGVIHPQQGFAGPLPRRNAGAGEQV